MTFCRCGVKRHKERFEKFEYRIRLCQAIHRDQWVWDFLPFPDNYEVEAAPSGRAPTSLGQWGNTGGAGEPPGR